MKLLYILLLFVAISCANSVANHSVPPNTNYPTQRSYLSPDLHSQTTKLSDFKNAGGDPPPEEETPAEETPAEETPEEAPAEETPQEETPQEETPQEETPQEEAPQEETEEDTELNKESTAQSYDGGQGGNKQDFAMKTFAPTYSEVQRTPIGGKKMQPEIHRFKNGYDPLYNQMLNGSINLYAAQMASKMLQNDLNVAVSQNAQEAESNPVSSNNTESDEGINNEEYRQNNEANHVNNETSNSGLVQYDELNPEELEAIQQQQQQNGEPSGGDYEPVAEETNQTVSNGYASEVQAPETASYHDAPFRFVNDATTHDIISLKKSLDELTTELSTDARNAKPLAATNPEDEKAIKEISGKAAPDPRIAKKIQEQQEAILKTGDPYEIAVLHKINTKIRKIQDAITRHEIGTQQELPAQTLVLQNLVSNVKSLRKQAEKQYQEQPMRTQAKDERHLHKMERLLKKMTKLMNDRSLSPKKFNHLSELYRDKLNRLRKKFKK